MSNTICFESPICISIHALLAESDLRACPVWSPRRYFYPRSPCGERLFDNLQVPETVSFLSTLSLRRATSYSQHVTRPSGYFYPRSPCGERHAIVIASTFHFTFLSTLSLRRATWTVCRGRRWARISIHALLAESDPLHRAAAAAGE